MKLCGCDLLQRVLFLYIFVCLFIYFCVVVVLCGVFGVFFVGFFVFLFLACLGFFVGVLLFCFWGNRHFVKIRQPLTLVFISLLKQLFTQILCQGSNTYYLLIIYYK